MTLYLNRKKTLIDSCVLYHLWKLSIRVSLRNGTKGGQQVWYGGKSGILILYWTRYPDTVSDVVYLCAHVCCEKTVGILHCNKKQEKDEQISGPVTGWLLSSYFARDL